VNQDQRIPIKEAYQKPLFGGETLDPLKDAKRLTRQVDLVRELMSDGVSRTLYQISAQVGCSESSASARLRDLRKVHFGGYIVDRTREGNTFYYRMVKK
jgi:hypothetical protein